MLAAPFDRVGPCEISCCGPSVDPWAQFDQFPNVLSVVNELAED